MQRTRSLSIAALPLSSKQGLERLGSHIRRARLRRSIRASDMAARCVVSLPTLRKIERGDPTISLGAVMAALWALGLEDRLANLLEQDPIGEAMADRNLPERVRSSKDDF